MRKEKCGLPKLLELGSLFHTEFLWLVQTDENTRGQKQTKQPQPYYSPCFFSDSRASCIKCLVFLIGIPWCLILLIFVSYAVPSPYAIEATCKLLYMHMLESHKFIWFLLCYPLSISCVFLIDSLDPAFHMTEPVRCKTGWQIHAGRGTRGCVLEIPPGDGYGFARKSRCKH